MYETKISGGVDAMGNLMNWVYQVKKVYMGPPPHKVMFEKMQTLCPRYVKYP